MKLVNDLNSRQLKPEQANAARTLNCHVSVTAGPGAGKTVVLVERYLEILRTQKVSIQEIIERGDGPVLLDTVTYRYSGHSPSDASSYREKTEIEEWRNVDSLLTYGQELLEAGICTSNELEETNAEIDVKTKA